MNNSQVRVESRWEETGKSLEGWIWSAPTRSGLVESSSLRKQHQNAAVVQGPSICALQLAPQFRLQDWPRVAATSGRCRDVFAALDGAWIPTECNGFSSKGAPNCAPTFPLSRLGLGRATGFLRPAWSIQVDCEAAWTPSVSPRFSVKLPANPVKRAEIPRTRSDSRDSDCSLFVEDAAATVLARSRSDSAPKESAS